MQGSDRPDNVLNRIQTNAVNHPERVALIDDSRQITYGQLHAEIVQTERFLQSQFHVGRGDRVGILIENNIESAVAFFAILRLGAIAVIINAKLAKPEVDYIISDSTPVLIIVGNADYGHLVSGAIPVHVIAAGRIEAPDVPLAEEYTQFDDYDDDNAIIMYTSGTTGLPKGAAITHHNIAYAVDCYIRDVGLTETDSTIIVVPVFYVTGLIAQLTVFLSLGAKIVILRRFEADLALRKIAQHRITHLHSVATVYLSLVSAMEYASGLDFSCVRQALCGGGPITNALIARFKVQLPRLDFRRIYGLTESTSPGTVMPVDVQQMPEKDCSSGRPMRWMQAKVVGDDGREVQPGEAGELLIKGDNVIRGYWNNPKANAASFADGWLRTGDIAKMDKDGFVYILDRKKDMIIRGGEKVFCSEVEGVLAQYPGVKEVAVIGVPDPYYGEKVKACVVPLEDVELTADQIIGFARTKLAKFKVPAVVEFLPELPRSAVGKILKSALKQ